MRYNREPTLTSTGYKSWCSPVADYLDRRESWIATATTDRLAEQMRQTSRVHAARASACLDGTQQCAYCAQAEDPKSWRAVMDSVPPGACHYCGAAEGRTTVDHVTPKRAGGAHNPVNLVRACAYCNSGKNWRAVDEWLAGDSPQATLVRLHRKQPPAQMALPISAVTNGRTGRHRRIVLVTEAEREAKRRKSRRLADLDWAGRYPHDYRAREIFARYGGDVRPVRTEARAA